MAPVTAQHETAALMLSLILTATRLLTLLVRMQTQIWSFVPKLNKYPFQVHGPVGHAWPVIAGSA